MNIAFATKAGRVPYYFHSLAGSLPMMNIKLLNVYQGVIAAFLASDFIKRDRKHDSTEVVYMRSITNADYILGKTVGILLVFAVLNGIVLLVSLAFHLLLSDTPFAWQPYAYYTLLMSIPTLVFMIGASSMMMNLVRSQAIVFVLLLGGCIASLVFIGKHIFYIFDIFAFYQPIMYSDFVGFGNLHDLLAVRGAYFLVGVGLVAFSILLMKRLRQSKVANTVAAGLAVICITAAATLIFTYLNNNYATRDYRTELQTLSKTVAGIPIPTLDRCSITLDHHGKNIDAVAELTIANNNDANLDSLLFTINPGLRVESVTDNSQSVEYYQNKHLLWIKPKTPLAPRMTEKLTVSYSGHIDERACYLDLKDERIEGRYAFWLFSVPKKYAIIEPNFVLLTPEALWYPVCGLTEGAAYPKRGSHDFVNFRLDVAVDHGLVAISQGMQSVDTTSRGVRYRFEPEFPLPQMSLVIGKYDEYSIEVDSTIYSLYVRPGHEFFEPYLGEVADTLPYLIRELKNDYELRIGLDYPYRNLALVEVPIQFYSYNRLWTFSQETVQPQVVFLPELGTTCDGTDFTRMKRISNRRQEKSNQEETPQEIQARYLTSFVKIDLLGVERNWRSLRNDTDNEIEPLFYILPNYISYSVHLTSDRWPVINYALESYVFSRATPPQDTRARMWQGITEAEKANFILKDNSLKDVISGEYDRRIVSAVMKEKGLYLFALLEGSAGSEAFSGALADFIKKNRLSNTPADSFLAAFQALTDYNLVSMIDSWYSDTILPGYDVENVQSYKVIDGERTRTQITFTISNPEPIDGVTKVSFRTRRRGRMFGPRWGGKSQEDDYERMVIVPAKSKKDIGVILDDPPGEMAIETYISINVPSVITKRFGEQELKENTRPFDGEKLIVLDSEPVISLDEYIVDNESAGFAVETSPEENRFRKLLLSLFGQDEDDKELYKGLRFWSPPKSWTATTDNRFYGRFIHSAFYKATGNGSGKVSWTADLDRQGLYDIYCYYPGIEEPHWMRRNREKTDKGEKTFLVYHDDGVDEVMLNLNTAEDGWNYLGTYHFSSGINKVELIDKGTGSIVIADAVKWIMK